MCYPTIGNIVTQDYRTAAVFQRLGIDFYCGGKRPLEEVCREKGLDLHVVQQELASLKHQPTPLQHRYEDWSADFLADYIVIHHHAYLHRMIPSISACAERLQNTLRPEKLAIADCWQQLTQLLHQHLEIEEQFLFPYIKNKNYQDASTHPFALHTVHLLEMQHEESGRLMQRIRTLSQDFTVPPDGGADFQRWYYLLASFENDLCVHLHLENNILFPKIIDL